MKIAIIEDEKITAEDLMDTLQKIDPSIQIDSVLPSIQKAEIYFASMPIIDLIFSDIQLQDGLCFELFRKIAIPCPVIFCTAYNEFALDAIRNNGIEYITKPFSTEDIEHALTKFHTLKSTFIGNKDEESWRIQNLSENLLMGTSDKTILVHYRDKTVPLKLESIAAFFKENEITYLKTFDHRKYALDKTLEQIEELAGSDFFRVSRQCVLHRNSVQEVVHLFNRKLHVITQIPLELSIEVSRYKITDFMNWLKSK